MSISKPTRQLQGLPASKRSILFRAVVAVLQSNPTLASVVKTWRTCSGDAGDNMPVSYDQCPWVRLSFASDTPVVFAATTLKEIAIVVTIEIATAGTCLDDNLDLWEMIEDALASEAPAPGGTGVNVKDYLRGAIRDAAGKPAGIYDLRVIQSGTQPSPRVDRKTGKEIPPFIRGGGVFAGKTVKPA